MKILFSIFPNFYKHVDVRGLAQLVREVGPGRRRFWAPLNEGLTNWYGVLRALKGVDFVGTFVWMPFYDENAPVAMTAKLKREVAYMRRVVAEVQAESPPPRV